MNTRDLTDTSRGRSDRIDTLRGLACLLLVAFHVVGYDASHGLGIPADAGLRTLADFFTHVRMPLFTFLSGYVYALHPVERQTWRLFVQKKLRRLLLPLIVVSSLYYAAHRIMFGTHEMAPDAFWTVYVYPYAHLWFLQALIVILACVSLLELAGLLGNVRKFAIVFGLTTALHLTLHVGQLPFSIGRAIYLAPFFLAGLGAYRYRDILQSTGARRLAQGICLVSILIGLYLSFRGAGIPERQTLLATTISLSTCLALLASMPRLSWLALVGGYSYAIYLYHLFFTAATSLALVGLGSDDLGLLFAAGLLAGILGPILVERVAVLKAAPRRLLLGQA